MSGAEAPERPRSRITPKRVVAALVLLALLLYGAAVLFEWRQGLWSPAPQDIGFGALLFIYAAYVLATDDLEIWDVALGFDGRASTSKFQPFLWSIVVVWGFVAVLAARWDAGLGATFVEIPENVLIVLGLAIGTGLAAKVITVNQVESGKLDKPEAEQPEGPAPLFLDDKGHVDLYKAQTMAFTFVAVGAFLAAVAAGLHDPASATSLPDIDPTLMVLMGFGSAAYLGGKLASGTTNTTDTFIASISRDVVSLAAAAPERTIILTGTNFGATRGSGQLIVNGVVLQSPIAKWVDDSIEFVFPQTGTAGSAWPTDGDPLVLQVSAGTLSNHVTILVRP
jgi:hypothetical protein